MGKAAIKPSLEGSGKNSSPNGLTIGLQLADTAWRVAIPIILFTFIGNKLDKAMGTNPLFIVSGLFLSLAVATVLVYKQIQVAYPDFFKKDTK